MEDQVDLKLCCICQMVHSKYKCPACEKYYCSVNCCKDHKNECNGISAMEEQVTLQYNEKMDYEYPTEDTVPLEKLEELRHSNEVKSCLKNSHVKNLISQIINNRNPTGTIAKAMQEPIFVELADACLKVIEPKKK